LPTLPADACFPLLAVTVELKNDISIRGTLKSVDQYLNIKLDDITILDELKYPHLSSVKNIFIRYVKAYFPLSTLGA
jgi:small nuclear ribonucleoprotein (snRNP)-like protein